MACFLVPMGEAIIASAIKKVVEKKEEEAIMLDTSQDKKDTTVSETTHKGLSWSRKLSWLTRLLWGGVILLAYEHIWHGEVIPWPPFLTAMKNPAEIGPMFHELATVGVGMSIFVTAIWVVMILIADQKARDISSTTIKKTI